LKINIFTIALCCVLPIVLSFQTAKTSKWEPAIQAFEAEDREQFPPQGGVLFVGSSSIRRWDTLKQDMAPLPVIHRGFGGAQMSDVLEYFHRLVLPYHPADIVIYVGGNDINGGKSPGQVFGDFRKFFARVHEAFPNTRIHVVSMKPSIKRKTSLPVLLRANALIEGFCASDDRLHFLDVLNPMLNTNGEPRPELYVEDLLHMTAEGYAIWTGIIKPHLQSVR
jgi:hypothetical protein